MSSNINKINQYRRWMILIVLFLCTSLVVGPFYAFSLFVDPLQAEFGWTSSQIIFSLSLSALGALLAPVFGKLMDKYGSRPIMIFCLIIMALGFLLRPLMTELWHWYALNIFQFTIGNGCSILPIGRLVGMWFPEKRGRIMGLTLMGNNFGGMTIPLIVGYFIQRGSWENAYLTLGFITLGLVLLTLLIIREKEVKKENIVNKSADLQNNTKGKDTIVSQLLRGPYFYALIFSIILATFTYNGVLSHMGDHFRKIDMNIALIPLLITIMATFGMLGKFSLGYLSEFIPVRITMIISLSGQIFTIILLLFFGQTVFIWLIVPLFGFFMGGYGALMNLIVQENYGLSEFGTIIGILTFSTVISSVLGPLIAGFSVENYGNYNFAFMINACFFGMAIIILSFLNKKRLTSALNKK